jgi:hypothetical protein
MSNERRQIKRDGTKPVSNSGRGDAKGDAKYDSENSYFNYLIDYKHNTSTFTLSKKAWKKHAKDAWNEGHREPIIDVSLEDDVRVVILDYNLWKQLDDNYGMEF